MGRASRFEEEGAGSSDGEGAEFAKELAVSDGNGGGGFGEIGGGERRKKEEAVGCGGGCSRGGDRMEGKKASHCHRKREKWRGLISSFFFFYFVLLLSLLRRRCDGVSRGFGIWGGVVRKKDNWGERARETERVQCWTIARAISLKMEMIG